MTRETTKAERAATKLRVVGSLQADSGRETHHGTYAKHPEFRRCPKCGCPGGLIWCPTCHGKQAA